MEKSPVPPPSETDEEEQLSEVLPDTLAEPQEMHGDDERDASPEAAIDVVADMRDQLDLIQVTGGQDEQRYQRDAKDLRVKAEANTREMTGRKTTVEKLVGELLDAPEDADAQAKMAAVEENLEVMEKIGLENGVLYMKLQDLAQQRSGEALLNMRRLDDMRNHIGEYLNKVLTATMDEDARGEIERVSNEIEETVARLDSLWSEFNDINSQTTEDMSALEVEKRKVSDARTAFLRATTVIAASSKQSDELDTSADTETLKKVRQSLGYDHTDTLVTDRDLSSESKAA